MAKANANESNEIKVALLSAHEHAGVKYEAGAEITVSQAEYDWLKNQGVVAEKNAI